jgi:transposase
VAILPSSLRHTDVREVGAARLLQLQARALGLRACLTASGLRPRHVRLGLAQILARALHPASERETWRWLRHDSALGELLGLQPSDLSKDSLYTAADALWQRHERLGSALFARECELFGLQPRIVFYDLTNTYHTGRPAHKYAAHGRSKQKRHDAPLVTLGLLLDGEGFPRRSEVLAGNVGEARTLQGAIERLDRGQGERPTVVFDGGIVSAANLRWLRQRGLHWVTVERQRQAAPERDPDTLWESAGGRELKVWRLQAEAGESAAAGRTETDGGAATPAGEQEAGAGAEARLCVWSPARDKDEQAMLERKRARYEAALRSLHEGLTTPRRLKNYAKVVRKVGRLERDYKLVACQYTVTVEPGEKGKAQAVRWEPNQRYRARERLRGTSLLRTSRVEWEDSRIVREYCRLADIEATFRSFKEELGLRPLYHRLAKRVAGHLFLTVLAYHVVHALRYRLKRKGIGYSWRSIRERMRTWVRLTTAMRTAEGKVWSQRQDVDPNNEQARIAAAAGLSFRRHRRLLPLDPAKISRSAGGEGSKK